MKKYFVLPFCLFFLKPSQTHVPLEERRLLNVDSFREGETKRFLGSRPS